MTVIHCTQLQVQSVPLFVWGSGDHFNDCAETMRWTAAAAATKLHIPTMPARKQGQLVILTCQTLSLTHTLTHTDPQGAGAERRQYPLNMPSELTISKRQRRRRIQRM